MDAELLAEGFGSATRASFEAAATGDFEAALARCAFDDAALILLRHEVTVDAKRVLPHVTGPWLALALAARLPAPDGLLAAARAVPVRDETTDVAAAYLFAALKSGLPREKVIAATRLASRRASSYLGSSLMIGLAEELADPTLTKLFGKVGDLRKQVDAVRATAERVWKLSVDELGAALPVQRGHKGATLRAAPRVGRNEPCPCGSGQKYKKCCADKPEATAVVAAAADRITVEQVDEIPLVELAKLDITLLKEKQLEAAFRRYTREGIWDHAERCAFMLAARRPAEREDFLDELILMLRSANEIERARPLVAELTSAEYRADHEIELAIAALPPGHLDVLDTAARRALATDTAIELALTLLRQSPALGILVGRGCVDAESLPDARVVMEMIEDARDELCLPPEDPHWELYDSLVAAEKEDADDEKSEQARTALAARVDQLQRELKAKEQQLAARAPVQEVVTTTVEPEKVRELKTTIEELRGVIAEGNAERAELRREVAALRAVTPTPVAVTPEPVETEDDGDAIDPAIRSVVLPALDPAARSALDRVPRTVAAESMRLLGALCAGDPWTWNRVKLARDMAKPVLMARVGIHHRMLMRPDGDELRVLDLIAREDLDTTLRKLRRS